MSNTLRGNVDGSIYWQQSFNGDEFASYRVVSITGCVFMSLLLKATNNTNINGVVDVNYSPCASPRLTIYSYNPTLRNYSPFKASNITLFVGDVLSATIRGNVVSVYRNGGFVISDTLQTANAGFDVAGRTSGQIGLSLTNSGAVIDDFDGGEVGGGAVGATSTPTAPPSPTPTLVPIPPTTRINAFHFGDTPDEYRATELMVRGALAAYVSAKGEPPACDETNPAIHPRTKWHSLVYWEWAGASIAIVCHYGHTHGTDPNQLNTTLGEVGAWFGAPGQSVSSPAQTFGIPIVITDTTITHDQIISRGLPSAYENVAKHEGYFWYVSHNSKCETDNPTLQEFNQRNCITDFRIQTHSHSIHDHAARFHSLTFEARVCNDPNNPATCGIVQKMGWVDMNELFTPPTGTRCFAEFNKDVPDGLIALPSTEQFYPSNRKTDTQPFDEFRCNWRLTLDDVLTHLSGFPTVPEHFPFEWWGVGINDIRFQFMVSNPIAGVNSMGMAEEPYCAQVARARPDLAAQCRMTGQKVHVNSGYILPIFPYGTYYFINGKNINASNDTDGDGVLDSRRWLNRWGDIQPDGMCKAVSLDCLPEVWSGNYSVPLTRAQVASGCTPATYGTTDDDAVRMRCRPVQGAKDIRPSNPDGTVNVPDFDWTPDGYKTWIAQAGVR